MEKNLKEKTSYDRAECLALLVEMSRALSEKGELRCPKRSDFTDDQVVAIKARLGPWGRALEAAGLKDKSRIEGIKLARTQKRINAKKRRTQIKKEKNERKKENEKKC